jgi:hypothetical protein
MTWLRVDKVGDNSFKILDLDYIRNRKDIVYTVDREELPDWIDRAISLLDLCEYNKPLEGVGEHLRNKQGQECYFISKKFLNNDCV